MTGEIDFKTKCPTTNCDLPWHGWVDVDNELMIYDGKKWVAKEEDKRVWNAFVDEMIRRAMTCMTCGEIHHQHADPNSKHGVTWAGEDGHSYRHPVYVSTALWLQQQKVPEA